MPIPLKRADLKNFAGKFVSAESELFDLLPSGTTIVIAYDGPREINSYDSECFICKRAVLLDSRDKPALAGVDITVVCAECYFKMEPKEPKDANTSTL